MTKIDIISGFLGAGKTTFIRALLDGALKGEQVVLIENEFGEIGIDGGFLQDAGIQIREMNQGCICCSLVGDFETSLKEVVDTYKPDRIIIEPSGVGKLSDIIGAVKKVSANLPVEINAAVTVVDVKKAKLYARNFGEFFLNQIQYAGVIVLSRTDIADGRKVEEALEIIRGINKEAKVITTPVEKLESSALMDIISQPDSMEEDVLREVMKHLAQHEAEAEEHERLHHHHHDHDEEEEEGHCCGHHHHDHDEEEEEGHCCGHHHDHDEEGHCCGHHHDHDEEGHCCGHHHDHDEEGHCCGHHHHHHHHGDHDADEVFTSWGKETPAGFDRSRLEQLLKELSETDKFGTVIRCKGMLQEAGSDRWMYFDLVPEQFEIREGAPSYIGKVVVIGAELKESALEEAFANE